ncbi:MAG: MarR family transcriptional regulator [Pyrinomonadaceae bacterium]|nr:MarR family transcriptional regulator [Pyrinomonadaceae bacterium]MCX7640761.1 MarR family transcriptional regulator [Pyrinomonadaceae bacterium]MDW8304656.1 MarR family winged helix-turn-helix transcriptional regulator [Acidobacteriota bacterium]
MSKNESPFNPEAQQKEIENKIVASLERISQIFRSLLWKQAKSFNLTPLQIQILIFLKYHNDEKSCVSYLSKEFNLSKPTVSEAISTLIKKGLIKKRKNLEDNRRQSFLLTESGIELTEKIELFAFPIKEIIKSFNQNEKQALWESLIRIISQANRKGLIPLQRMCFTCKFYERRQGTDFCKLLDTELKIHQIRIDCPEFIEA